MKQIKEKVIKATADFVVLDLQPYSVTSADSFKQLLRTVSSNAELPLPTSYNVKQRVKVMTEEAEAKIALVLRGTKPALTTDICAVIARASSG